MDTENRDEYLRKEFARAFGWFEHRDVMYARYDRADEKPQTPTWEQIFIEVGRMLNRSQTLTNEFRYDSIEQRLTATEDWIHSKKDQLL